MTEAKEAQQEKLAEKLKQADLRQLKKASKEVAEAAWKTVMAVHNQAVVEWEANKLVLRAEGTKVKDLPKKPKRPVKPKPVVESKSESSSSEHDEEGSAEEIMSQGPGSMTF